MSSTEQEIMDATYRVLVDVGYSELSIRRIADEFDGSQSLIYYHYDDKEDLLADFLEFLLGEFEGEIDAIDAEDPAERLTALVELVVPQAENPDHLPFQQTLEEVRTQTPYHDRFRGLFDEFDGTLQSELRTTIQRGVDDGTFGDVDADEAADELLLLLYGVVARCVPMRDWEGIERGQALIDARIDAWRAC